MRCKIFLIVLATIVLPHFAFACSCGFQIMSVEKILNYETVIKGEIIAKDTAHTIINLAGDTIDNFLPYFKYTIKVEEWIHGARQKSLLTFYSHTQSSACGVNYSLGDRYYLYLYDYEGNNYTGLCANNLRIDKAKRKYKKQIRKFKKAKKLKTWKDVNGDKIAYGKIINQKAVGSWVFYHRDGSVKKKGNYENGIPVGTWYEYLDHRNSLSKHASLSQDQLNALQNKKNIKWRSVKFENGKRKDVSLLLESNEN